MERALPQESAAGAGRLERARVLAGLMAVAAGRRPHRRRTTWCSGRRMSGVIFVPFPMVIWTGLALSPTFNAAFPWFVDVLGGRQSARTLHFFITIALTAFRGGACGDGGDVGIPGADAGHDYGPWNGVGGGAGMSPISRRKLITGGAVTAAVGVSGLAAAGRIAERYGLIPPDAGTLYGAGGDADVCGTAAAGPACSGAGVSAEHDFEGAAAE